MRSWHGRWNTDPETGFSELHPRLFVVQCCHSQCLGSEARETGICRVFEGAGQRFERECERDRERGG